MRNTRFSITWLLIFATSAPILSTLAEDSVPVLIWGGDSLGLDSSPVNPLRRTSQADFEKIVGRRVGTGSPPVLVFMRDNLCVEDFVQHKKDLMQLKKISSLQYLPAVESPLSVFEKLSSYNQSVEEEFETVSEGQLIITKATDLDSVSETFNMIKESSPNLIAALTGRSCSYSRSERVRRAVEGKADEQPGNTTITPFIIAVNESRLLAYAESAVFHVGYDGTNITLESPISVESTGNASLIQKPVDITAKFGNGPTLKFMFNETVAGYWYLQRIEATQDGVSYNMTTRTELVFPRTFSYHCSPTISFTNSTETKDNKPWFLNFTEFQIQLDATNFTDSYDCVGFTSIPIWSGLFVTFFLAMIMIWGITMILDIRTMDRFDDPKGKTITVTATE